MKKRDMPVKLIRKVDHSKDITYWLKQSASDRISAVEFLREQFYIMSGCRKVPRLEKIISRRPFKS